MSLIRIVLVLAFVVLCVAGGAVYWVYAAVTTPKTHERARDFIVIEKGSTPSRIIEKLEAEGVIANASATKIYLRLVGDASKLQAGEYQFESPITPLQVLTELEKGESQTVRLTIPEGFTRFDIAKRIAEKFPNHPEANEQAILRMMDDTRYIADIAPGAKNLEGYLYPSTYNLPRDASPSQIVELLTAQFKKLWKPEWTEKARAMGRKPHELVTIASLIETESKFEAERPVVASVIYNRLGRGMALGIDQTAVYIAKMENRWDGTIHRSDLESTSPYNTRKFAGLPPGPISSVSVSAIEAALNPAQTDYIFYVLNVQANDGSHHFYASAADFERGKAEYQRWLEQQRREKRASEANNATTP